MKLTLLAFALLGAVLPGCFAAKAADMTLASTDGSQWGVMRLGDDGILHIEASNCVVRTNFCHRYRRTDCAPSDKEVISRLVWRSSDLHGAWQATAVARLHADGKLSFELPAAPESDAPNCLHPMAAALSSAEQEAVTGLALTSDLHTANVVIPAAGGLLVHNDGPVHVMGKHVDPVCKCQDGIAAAEQCANHGDHTCALCHEGFYLTSNSKCEKCELGHECKGDTAVPVPCGSASRYSDVRGLGKCKSCEAGSFTSGGSSPETRTHCEKCGPGEACSAGKVTKCEAGTYGNGVECLPCGDPNTYSDEIGAGKCKTCPSGRRTHGSTDLTKRGHTSCTKCIVGHYCPDGVQELPCPPGTSTENEEGLSRCKPCNEPLLYATGYGNAACKPCPTDHEALGARNKRTECRLCPAGSECIEGDAHLCKPGTYGEGGSCKPCNDDSKYSDDEGAPSCLTCGKGHTTGMHKMLPDADVGEPTKRKRCHDCPAGLACDGSSTVVECTAGFFSPAKSDVCIPCGHDSDGTERAEPNAWYSSARSGTCEKCGLGYTTGHLAGGLMEDVDTGSPGQRTVCRPCPAGHRCDGTDDIKPCPANTFSPGKQADCSACEAGSYVSEASNAVGAIHCDFCSRGHYITPQGSCVPCPFGHECDGTLEREDWDKLGPNPKKCEPGTFAEAGYERCMKCDNDRLYARLSGSTECIPCGAGYYTVGGSNGRGHNDCKACEAGFECDGSSRPVQFAGECPDGELEPNEQARVQWDQCAECNEGFGLKNMKCRLCDGKTEFSPQKNNQDCEPVTQCHLDEDKYEFRAPTTTSDRECKHHRTPCDLTSEWIVQPASNYDERVCADKHCKCRNGVGSTKSACPEHEQFHCAQCSAPYFLKSETETESGTPECTKWKSCTADEFMVAEGTDTTDRVCREKVCVCSGGLPHIGELCKGNGEEHCKSCSGEHWLNPTTGRCDPWHTCDDSEYEIIPPTNTQDRKCRTKECYCPYGTASPADVCPMHGSHHCSKCADGGYFEMDGNNQCVIKMCTCDFGIPSWGPDCPGHLQVHCQMCHAGEDRYVSENSNCVRRKLCTGEQYDVHGHSNYGHGDDRECALRRCSCANGIGVTGSACPASFSEPEPEYCAQCDPNYYLSGKACKPISPECDPDYEYESRRPSRTQDRICIRLVCRCTNGTPTMGLACPYNGATSCAQCNQGWGGIDCQVDLVAQERKEKAAAQERKEKEAAQERDEKAAAQERDDKAAEAAEQSAKEKQVKAREAQERDEKAAAQAAQERDEKAAAQERDDKAAEHSSKEKLFKAHEAEERSNKASEERSTKDQEERSNKASERNSKEQERAFKGQEAQERTDKATAEERRNKATEQRQKDQELTRYTYSQARQMLN